MSGYSLRPDDPEGGADRQEKSDADPPAESHDSSDCRSGSTATAASLLRVQDATRIIDCLIRGQKDDAIARSLGVSTRTIDRRMVLLMDAVGARSRFQLGLRLTPDLLAVLRSMAGDSAAGEGRGLVDEPVPRRLRQAERLRKQLDRRGRPVQAVMWLWLEPDDPNAPAAGSSPARPVDRRNGGCRPQRREHGVSVGVAIERVQCACCS